jgi:hypothetical protein
MSRQSFRANPSGNSLELRAAINRSARPVRFVPQAAYVGDLDSRRVHVLNLRFRFRFCFVFWATLPQAWLCPSQ